MQILQTALKIGSAIAEEKEKLIEEVHHDLKLLENELEVKEKEFFGGLEIGYLDIAAFFIGHWLQVRQEVMEIELIHEEKHPHLCKWLAKLLKIDVVHGRVPPKEKHIAFMKARIEAAKFSSK